MPAVSTDTSSGSILRPRYSPMPETDAGVQPGHLKKWVVQAIIVISVLFALLAVGFWCVARRIRNKRKALAAQTGQGTVPQQPPYPFGQTQNPGYPVTMTIWAAPPLPQQAYLMTPRNSPPAPPPGR